MPTYVLPWPPALNHLWRSTVVAGRPRVLMSARGRQYRQEALVRLLGSAKAPPGRLAVEVDLHPPDRRRRDIDGTVKILLDVLTHARIYEDDSLIDRLTITRMPPTTGGRVVVRITPWEGSNDPARA